MATLTFEDAIATVQAEITDLRSVPERLASNSARDILAGLERALWALKEVQEAIG